MSRRYSTLVLSLLMLPLLFIPARGQNAGGQSLQLTVEQAVKLGLENSKSLHASQMKVEYADAKETEVKSARLPSLKFNGTYTRLSEVPSFTIDLPPALGGGSIPISPAILNNYNMKLSLVQPVFTGFKLENGAKAAEFSTRASEQDYTKDKS